MTAITQTCKSRFIHNDNNEVEEDSGVHFKSGNGLFCHRYYIVNVSSEI